MRTILGPFMQSKISRDLHKTRLIRPSLYAPRSHVELSEEQLKPLFLFKTRLREDAF